MPGIGPQTTPRTAPLLSGVEQSAAGSLGTSRAFLQASISQLAEMIDAGARTADSAKKKAGGWRLRNASVMVDPGRRILALHADYALSEG